MTDTTSTRVIEQSTRIAASPSTVWSFWTDPKRLCEWWGVSAEVVAEPGGLFRVDMGDGPIMRGEFVELDPPRRLVFTFGWEHNAPGEALSPGSTQVEVRLVADGDDTIVTLRHSSVPEIHADDHTKGWALFVGQRLPAAISNTAH